MYKNNFTLKKRRICYRELYNSSIVTLGNEITPKGLLLSLFLVKQFWMIDVLLCFIYKTSLNSIYVKFKRRKIN